MPEYRVVGVLTDSSRLSNDLEKIVIILKKDQNSEP